MGLSVITINGIEAAYRNLYGASIFDDITLPEDMDKQLLVERIFVHAGEFSIMYSDPDYFHWQTLNFFKSHLRSFEEWWKVLYELEYNPLENYDRFEHWTDAGTHSDASTGSAQDTQQNTSGTTYGRHDTTTKAAFNSDSYEPYEKVTAGGTDTTTGNASGTSFSSGASQGKEDSVHDGRIHGNIGVTTSQQMAQSSIDLYQFNIYEEIAKLYTDEFCIKVY